MFFVRDIPVVIEPGVGVLETSMTVADPKAGERNVAAHFYRVNFDEKIAATLPLIVTTQHPHVFSLHDNLEVTPLLLVYDLLGRLALMYVRDKGSSWERKDVSAEHAGKTITQFSVRFCFGGLKERNKFVSLMGTMAEQVRNGNNPNKSEMLEAVTLLSRSRVAPVVLPVAIAKSKLRNVRL